MFWVIIIIIVLTIAFILLKIYYKIIKIYKFKKSNNKSVIYKNNELIEFKNHETITNVEDLKEDENIERKVVDNEPKNIKYLII